MKARPADQPPHFCSAHSRLWPWLRLRLRLLLQLPLDARRCPRHLGPGNSTARVQFREGEVNNCATAFNPVLEMSDGIFIGTLLVSIHGRIVIVDELLDPRIWCWHVVTRILGRRQGGLVGGYVRRIVRIIMGPVHRYTDSVIGLQRCTLQQQHAR